MTFYLTRSLLLTSRRPLSSVHPQWGDLAIALREHRDRIHADSALTVDDVLHRHYLEIIFHVLKNQPNIIHEIFSLTGFVTLVFRPRSSENPNNYNVAIAIEHGVNSIVRTHNEHNVPFPSPLDCLLLFLSTGPPHVLAQVVTHLIGSLTPLTRDKSWQVDFSTLRTRYPGLVRLSVTHVLLPFFKFAAMLSAASSDAADLMISGGITKVINDLWANQFHEPPEGRFGGRTSLPELRKESLSLLGALSKHSGAHEFVKGLLDRGEVGFMDQTFPGRNWDKLRDYSNNVYRAEIDFHTAELILVLLEHFLWLPSDNQSTPSILKFLSYIML